MAEAENTPDIQKYQVELTELELFDIVSVIEATIKDGDEFAKARGLSGQELLEVKQRQQILGDIALKLAAVTGWRPKAEREGPQN